MATNIGINGYGRIRREDPCGTPAAPTMSRTLSPVNSAAPTGRQRPWRGIYDYDAGSRGASSISSATMRSAS
jgi:hypothetical protein